jgi:hypothetical protein
MRRKLMKRVLIACLNIALFCPWPAAHGQELANAATQWGKMCSSAGEAAYSIARSRDAGVPLGDHFQNAVEPTGQNARRENVIRSVALEVYRKPDWTPALARELIEVRCARSAPGRFKRKR